MTDAQDLLRRTTCPECGRSSFYLYTDGDVSCAECGRPFARNVPQLATTPPRPRIGLRQGESANPLMRHEEDWYFTFGIGHPLAGQFVRFRGTVESAREQMTTIFGLNWSRQYAKGEALSIIRTRGLRELVLSLAQPEGREPQPEAQAQA
jgi:hypothetical protein